MLAWIRRLLAPPVFDDEEKSRVARLLNTVVLAVLATALVILVVEVVSYGLSLNSELLFTIYVAAVFVPLMLGFLLLVRRGHLRVAAIILLTALWAPMSYWVLTVAGISSDSSIMSFPLIVVLAGLLLGGEAALVYTGLSVLVCLVAYYTEINGLLVVAAKPIVMMDLMIAGVVLILTGLLLLHAMNSMLGALNRARTNERAQITTNRALESMRQSLEQRVADRTRDLEVRSRYLQAAVEVSRAATSILDPEELMWRVANLIRERFDLYHVGIFLLDETGRWAEYRAGAGESGQRLAQEEFRLPIGGESLVGWCMAHAQARIIKDVHREFGGYEHPLVPRTRSEAALPLSARGQIVGALSVQSTWVSAFDEQMVASLQTMADQVAVALDNARLFAESQRALETTRRAYGDLSRQAWSDLLRARGDWGYVYTGHAVALAHDEWHPDLIQAHRSGTIVQGQAGSEPVLAIPLQVRDQSVGVLGFSKGETGEPWTGEETELLETLVRQLGVALESAQLFEETQRRAARERLTGEVAARIRQTLDLDTVLKTAAEEIRQALGVPEVVVRLAAQPAGGPATGGNGDQSPQTGGQHV
jgi:GAF domain-containing protein